MSNAVPGAAVLARVREYVLGTDATLLMMNLLGDLRKLDVHQVCDFLWLLDLELSASRSAGTGSPSKLLEVIRSYVEADPAARFAVACETIEVETLGACGLLDVESFKKNLRKKNTFLKYRQTKYNLIREESEGYSKLVTELLSDGPVDVVVCNCLALIGYFRLDPNRVLDLVLDVTGDAPDRMCDFCQVLFVAPVSSNSKIEDLLGFKLSRLELIPVEEARKSVLRSVAVLLVRGLCSVTSILPHLRISAVVQACKAADEKFSSNQANNSEMAAEGTVTSDEGDWIFTNLVSMVLSRENGWQVAEALLRAVPGGYERHVFRNKEAVRNLQDFLLRELGPLYNGLVRKQQIQMDAQGLQLNATNAESFLGRFGEVLTWLGPDAIGGHVTLDTRLLHQVVRILGAIKDTAGSRLDGILVSCVLPAISLLPSSSPSIMRSLWEDVLKSMDPIRRYALYERWREITERRPIRPELVASRKVAQEHINFALKRFCSDEDMNLVPARRFAKASHTHPLLAFKYALTISDNLIPFMVRSLDMCSGVARDVLVFLICDQLVQTKADKLKGDLTNDALWFSALCKLVGDAFTRCPEVDLHPLLGLVFNRSLVKKDWIYLRIVEKLLASTGLIDIVSDYSHDVLESCAGGDVLRLLATAAFSVAHQQRARFLFFADGSRDIALARLKQLLDPYLARFFVGMALARKELLMDVKLAFPDAPEKSLAYNALMFDRLSAVFFQLGTFVSAEYPVQKLNQALPSLSDLLRKFKVDPVDAFYISRLATGSKKLTVSGRFLVEDMQRAFPVLGEHESLIDLYSRFWELSLYDVILPRGQYETERTGVEGIKKELEKEDSNSSVKKMLSKTRELLVSLKAEQQSQSLRFDAFKRIVAESRSQWTGALMAPHGEHENNILPFLQDCVLPRALSSPEDAFYVCNFLSQAVFDPISSGRIEFTPIERAFLTSALPCLLRVASTCTERETDSLGVLLSELIGWIQSFEAVVESKGEPGYITSIPDWNFLVGLKLSITKVLVSWLRTGKSESTDLLASSRALALLSALKDCFPDSERDADILSSRLAVLSNLAVGDDEEDDSIDEFDVVQRTKVRDKAVALVRALKRRKDLGKLRGADGKFVVPVAPPLAIPEQPSTVTSAAPPDRGPSLTRVTLTTGKAQPATSNNASATVSSRQATIISTGTQQPVQKEPPPQVKPLKVEPLGNGQIVSLVSSLGQNQPMSQKKAEVPTSGADASTQAKGQYQQQRGARQAESKQGGGNQSQARPPLVTDKSNAQSMKDDANSSSSQAGANQPPRLQTSDQVAPAKDQGARSNATGSTQQGGGGGNRRGQNRGQQTSEKSGRTTPRPPPDAGDGAKGGSGTGSNRSQEPNPPSSKEQRSGSANPPLPRNASGRFDKDAAQVDQPQRGGSGQRNDQSGRGLDRASEQQYQQRRYEQDRGSAPLESQRAGGRGNKRGRSAAERPAASEDSGNVQHKRGRYDDEPQGHERGGGERDRDRDRDRGGDRERDRDRGVDRSGERREDRSDRRDDRGGDQRRDDRGVERERDRGDRGEERGGERRDDRGGERRDERGGDRRDERRDDRGGGGAGRGPTPSLPEPQHRRSKGPPAQRGRDRSQPPPMRRDDGYQGGGGGRRHRQGR